jgi:hypothetical protein
MDSARASPKRPLRFKGRPFLKVGLLTLRNRWLQARMCADAAESHSSRRSLEPEQGSGLAGPRFVRDQDDGPVLCSVFYRYICPPPSRQVASAG